MACSFLYFDSERSSGENLSSSSASPNLIWALLWDHSLHHFLYRGSRIGFRSAEAELQEALPWRRNFGRNQKQSSARMRALLAVAHSYSLQWIRCPVQQIASLLAVMPCKAGLPSHWLKRKPSSRHQRSKLPSWKLWQLHSI